MARKLIGTFTKILNQRHLLKREVAQNHAGGCCKSLHAGGDLRESAQHPTRFEVIVDSRRVEEVLWLNATAGLLQKVQEDQVHLDVAFSTHGNLAAVSASKFELDWDEEYRSGWRPPLIARRPRRHPIRQVQRLQTTILEVGDRSFSNLLGLRDSLSLSFWRNQPVQWDGFPMDQCPRGFRFSIRKIKGGELERAEEEQVVVS